MASPVIDERVPAGADSTTSDGLRDVTRLALRLGCTAFGGPAAHIAMLRHEAVERRAWLAEPRFLDLLGVTSIIPGPNSTEMVMLVGRERAGAKGLICAGVAFILPAAAITLSLAWVYVEYSAKPAISWLLWGLQPVIVAIVATALLSLGRTALRDRASLIAGTLLFALSLMGINELAILVAGGLSILVIRSLSTGTAAAIAAGALLILPGSVTAQAALTNGVAYSHLRLALTFLKIGSVLYGSGYVLIAFLRNDFVERLGWITEEQLIDAVAIGQLTPGPVLSTATFVGYLAGGFTGAVLATVAIFLPAFAFAGLGHQLAGRFRGHATLSHLLDGINIAALGLLAAVAVHLTQEAIDGLTSSLLAVLSTLLLLTFRLNPTYLLALGASAGALRWLAA